MTNQKTNIDSFVASEDLTAGDIVKLDSNGEAAKVSTAEATDAIGIVYADADEDERVSVVTNGVLDGVHVLVEDTDQSAGYDSAIAQGDHLVISGKASGTYAVGQALSSIDGTSVTTSDATTIVAKALEAVTGSTGEDTYTTIKAYVRFV